MPCGSGGSQNCASYDVKSRLPLCPQTELCLGNPVDIVCNLKSKFEPHFYTPPKLPLEGLTTYKNHYIPWDVKSRVLPMKPNVKPTLERVYRQMNDTPSEVTTWYKYQFPAHKVQCYKKPPWANTRKSVLLEGPVSYTTTFQEGFPPKQGKPADTTKPKHQFISKKSDIDFNTSYLTNYLDWNVGPYKKAWGPDAKSGEWAAQECCTPFSGISIYRATYKGPYQPARKSYKPRFTPSRTVFEGYTTYNASYQPYYFTKAACASRTHCEDTLTPNLRQQWNLDEKYPLIECQDWQYPPPPKWSPAPCPPVPECTPCYKLKKTVGTDDSVQIDMIPNENLYCDS